MESNGPHILSKLEYTKTLKDGILRVRLRLDIVEENIINWINSLMGYFIDKHLPFPVVQSIAMKLWKHHRLINTQDHMLDAFYAGLWHFVKCPILLKCWEPGMILSRMPYFYSNVG